MANELLDRIGFEIPIVLAPMGGTVGPELCAAVSNAGGLGMLAIWWAEPSAASARIRNTRALTSRPFGVNLNLNYPQDRHLEVAIEERVPVVSFFWGQDRALVRRAKDAGIVVVQIVASSEQARRAADMGVDAIVAQGWEAGGHVYSTVATMALVPAVVDAVAPLPVMAAGGIADGRGVAAALALGAGAAWIGTRFILASEVDRNNANPEAILAAGESDTMMGRDANPTWRDAPMRWIGKPVDPGTSEYWPETAQLAGQGVGLAKKIQPAAEIVREIWSEAQTTMQALQRFGSPASLQRTA